jgi:hypothetical protein
MEITLYSWDVIYLDIENESEIANTLYEWKEIHYSSDNCCYFLDWNNDFIYSEYEWDWLLREDCIYTKDEGYIHNENKYYECEDSWNYYQSNDDLYYNNSNSEWYESIDGLLSIDWEWYSEDEVSSCNDCWECYFTDNWPNCNCSNWLDCYHSENSKFMCREDTKFKIWFEIEKEEEVNDDTIEKLKELQFRCEEDWSVNWWEYISPVLDLYKSYERMTSHSSIVDMIEDYDISNNCGWHIHISEYNKNSERLFDWISDYMPLFWAIYPKRALNFYCHKNNNPRKERYSVFNYRTWLDTVEIRIFPWLNKLSQLEFRINLCKFILENQIKTKQEAIRKINSIEFINIIHPIYTTIERKERLFKRIIKAYDLVDSQWEVIFNWLKTFCEELWK